MCTPTGMHTCSHICLDASVYVSADAHMYRYFCQKSFRFRAERDFLVDLCLHFMFPDKPFLFNSDFGIDRMLGKS